MGEDLAVFVNLMAAAVLVGNELGTWAVVQPALQRLAFREEVVAEQQITRRYGYVMPFLMLLTIVTGFVAAGLTDGSRSHLLLAASACFAAMLAITLLGNVPLNVRTLRFSPTDDAGEWRAIRRRWERLHRIRVLLDVAGLACIAAAAV